MTGKTRKNVVAMESKAIAPEGAPALPGFVPGKPLMLQAMLNPKLRESLDWATESFCNSPSAPDHVKGNPMVVISALDISLSRGLNPLQVINGMFAHKGKLGMTAELMLAILQNPVSPLIKGEPQWEEVGDWSKVEGKFATKNNGKGDFNTATYTREDEKGLGVICHIHWVDEDEPSTYGPFMLSDAHPRFSTDWAHRPKYQLRRRTLRDIVRQFRSGALYGMVVDREEADIYGANNARVVGESSTVQKTAASKMDDLAHSMGYGEEADDVIEADPANDEQDVADDFDGDFDEADNYDDPDLFANKAAGMVKLWMSQKNPAYEIKQDKAGAALAQVIKKSEKFDHIAELFHRNMDTILLMEQKEQDELNKLAQDRREKLKKDDG